MRVLMLGWEFPPFISGGLGTACFGLTKALSQRKVEITYVLPKPVNAEYTRHVTLLSPQDPGKYFPPDEPPEQLAPKATRTPGQVASRYRIEPPVADPALQTVDFRAVPSHVTSPYPGSPSLAASAGRAAAVKNRHGQPLNDRFGRVIAQSGATAMASVWPARADAVYEGDVVREARRYAALCLDLAKGLKFDLIHAHDWVTFPAAAAVAGAHGKPLIVHVHSTELDRTGRLEHNAVFNIEKQGMIAATRVITVSHLTQAILVHRYGIDPSKVEVVYNGVERKTFEPGPRVGIRKGDRIVLFLGRITHQKGPSYFIEMAQRVLEKMDQVKFIMAGSGDQISQIIELAAAKGIGHKVLFTGFLQGQDVERIFEMADVYVMPSVSEPFGIAPLEAIRHDVPVILSNTAGAGEVLKHVLKVDFWDVNEIADKVIAVLKHPPLASTLKRQADIEVRRLTWDQTAERCLEVYHRATHQV